ncbi:MAG: hypothetical protein A2X86_05525 [Bdellovibrionales bacterium GWA2_49_15]|nr:MAG: hypothetical protein A2X86_05525 [Bdellovibrionales bacterium GWA2_49_15]
MVSNLIWKSKFGNWRSWLLFIYLVIQTPSLFANNYSYKSFFGSCPARPASEFALLIAKRFEEKKSLGDLKKYLENGHHSERYFVSNYKVDFDPLYERITIKLECPGPIYRVTFYSTKGTRPKSYDDLILASDGNFYNKIFADFLTEEGKLTKKLPILAMPESRYGRELWSGLKRISTSIYGLELEKNLTEMIVNKDGTLTLILSINSHPVSVFFGKNEWEDKILKLGRLVTYTQNQQRIPSIVNMTNSKKVVVKFSE